MVHRKTARIRGIMHTSGIVSPLGRRFFSSKAPHFSLLNIRFSRSRIRYVRAALKPLPFGKAFSASHRKSIT